jgi:hypothetical protein
MQRSLLLLLLILVACNSKITKQEQAEETVKLFLDSTLNDPRTYQSVKFEKIQPLIISLNDLPESKRLSFLTDSFNKEKKNLTKRFQVTSKEYDTENKRLFDSIDKVVEKRLTLMNEFHIKFGGYILQHSYRIEDKKGSLVIDTVKFALDEKLTKVLYTKKL